MAITQGAMFQYGAYYIGMARRSSAGYPMGMVADPDAPGTDVTLHAKVSSKPVSISFPEPSYGKVTEYAGMTLGAQIDTGMTDLGEGSFELSRHLEDVTAALTGASVDTTTVSEWLQIPLNIEQAVLKSFLMWFTVRVQDEDGADYYQHYVFPNVQLRRPTFTANQTDGQNPNPFSYGFVPSRGNRTLDGRLFTATGMNIVGSTDMMYMVRTRYPIHVTTYVADGTETTFTTYYKPFYSAVDQSHNSFTSNGANGTLTSLSTSTGAAVMSAAGTSADINVLMYQHSAVLVS